MHSHVSHLQMHFVDTMHSEAYTFTYICTHSDAFDTVRILTHSYAYRSFPLLSLLCVPGRTSFDKTYLENLVEKVARVTRAAHRPRNIVAGTRIQPTDDTVEEEGDGEESDEDLDGM